MAIKVGKRKAIVDQTVIDYYQVVAEDALREIFDKIHNSPKMIAKSILEKKRGDIARLNAILTRDGPGTGIDLEVTRLRGIDFERIYAEEIDGQTWFIGQTKDLKIQTVKGRNRSTRYSHGSSSFGEFHDLGDYKVYFPAQALATPKIKDIHFVPDRDPKTTARHFHHTASMRPNFHHPVEMIPNTCWGGFSEVVAANMEACDLSDLFRMLRIFVGRRNPSSLLQRNVGHEILDEEENEQTPF